MHRGEQKSRIETGDNAMESQVSGDKGTSNCIQADGREDIKFENEGSILMLAETVLQEEGVSGKTLESGHCH
jgi:hypothetical protein